VFWSFPHRGVWLLLAATACMLPGPPQAMGVDRPHLFGVGTANGGWTLLEPDGYTDAMYDTMARVGTTSTRIGASWANIETSPGVYDFSALDGDVAQCLLHGIEPYCLIVNTPAWASPTGEATHEYPPLPEFEDEFQTFCTVLASRYAGQVRYWEFWNEQNGYGWHTDGGFNRVDEYVPFLRLAYQGLKAGDPDCMVAIGGLDDPDIDGSDGFGWRGAGYMWLFYDELNRRGWGDEEIFDAVADHPYHSREEITDLRLKLRALHDVLDAHGDGNKPIWITEYGWTTKSDDVSQQDQAQLFTQYLSILCEPEFSYVTMASCLAISDMEVGYEGWGVTDQNLRPKPAFYAFQSFPRGDAPQISHVAWDPVDAGTVQITWQTHIPASSQMEYGPTSAYGSTTTIDPAPVTQHAVALTNLTPGGVYHFRVLSGSPEGTSASADYILRCPDGTVPNPGFEGGIGPGIGQWWRAAGRSFCTDGVRLDADKVHDGSHSQAVITVGGWGDRYMDDAIYTHVAATVGVDCTFTAWTRLETDAGIPHTLARRVGIDPTGGVDPAGPSVAWSSWDTQEYGWTPMHASATAQAPIITVFVYAKSQIDGPYWYSLFVDDASLEWNVFYLKPDFDGDGDVDLFDFGQFQACLTGSGNEQVLPECQNARLDDDVDVDGDDFSLFQGCISGADIPADPGCLN
jgi:hypothetical protein